MVGRLLVAIDKVAKMALPNQHIVMSKTIWSDSFPSKFICSLMMSFLFTNYNSLLAVQIQYMFTPTNHYKP